MLAIIGKVESGFLTQFERHLKHPVEEVWSYLTVNDKLVENQKTSSLKSKIDIV